VKDARGLLELKPDAVLTPDLIRRQFNRIWDRFDPEKMAGWGGDFVAMTEVKRAALRDAARALMAPFGDDLEVEHSDPQPGDLRQNADLDEVFGI
jgi:hypothetical protein